MKNSSKILFSIIILTLSSNFVFSQLKVENNGSLYVNSYAGNWGRANWTKIHYQYSCAYHLNNTYYNSDVFYVRGDGYAWTRHGWLTASDSTLKANIEGIQSSLSKVKDLRGVQYNRKYTIDSLVSDENVVSASSHVKKTKFTKLEPKEYGLIAQEVESIIPEAVVLMPDSTKAISYTSLIPVLIEAIKEQQKQIETLQSIVNLHEKELSKLKNCCNSNANSKLKKSSIPQNNLDLLDTQIFYTKISQIRLMKYQKSIIFFLNLRKQQFLAYII